MTSATLPCVIHCEKVLNDLNGFAGYGKNQLNPVPLEELLKTDQFRERPFKQYNKCSSEKAEYVEV